MAEILRLEAITLQNLEGRMVFQGLDWSLATGGRAQVHASAGTGTSAFLRLCAGLAHPQEGRVILDGLPLGPYAFDHPFLKRGGMGWVPTEGGLLANLSLLANVALPLRFLRGHAHSRAEEIAQEALDQAGLGPQAGRRPHALEPRERWLGALVRAAVTHPELWLLDQPPGKLDPTQRRGTERILLDAASDAGTAFVIAGSKDWTGLAAAEFHLEQGRLVPGGV